MKKKISLLILVLLMIFMVHQTAMAFSAPVLEGNSVWRSSSQNAVIRFMSNSDGVYYYKVTDNESPPDFSGDLSGVDSGSAIANDTEVLTLSDLTSGPKYLHLILKDSEETSSNTLTVAMPHDIYFFDDFEAYAVNTQANSGKLSFTQIHNGSGDGNQKIFNEDTNKFFSLSGRSSWASDQNVVLPAGMSGIIELEAKIKPVSGTDPAYLRLFNSTNDGATVVARNGYWHVRVNNINTSLDVAYVSDTWYLVKLSYYTDKNEFDIWIDGVKVNSAPLSGTFDSSYNLYLTAGNGSSTQSAFDDVMLCLKNYEEPVYMCEIDGMGYESLDEALGIAEDGDTIKLLSDIDFSKSIIADNKTLSIDLNGFNLMVENVDGHALKAKNTGTLNISDQSGIGLLTVNSLGEDKHCANAVSGGSINIEGNLTASIPPGALSRQDVIAAYADGSGSEINLIGNASGNMAGAYSQNGALINVEGNVSGSYYGAFAAYGGSLKIIGDISGDTNGLTVEYGGIAEVNGDIAGETAIYIRNISGWNPPEIHIEGNITGTGYAIEATGDADIDITGDVMGNISMSDSQITSTINVTGDITGNAVLAPAVNLDTGTMVVTGNIASETGFGVASNSTFTLNGNITAKQGVHSSAPGGNIVINGNILADGGIGVYANNGATVTVNGTITGASPYIKLDYVDMAEGSGTEEGDYYKYSTYTNNNPAYVHTVYVKMPPAEPEHGVLQFDSSYFGAYEGYNGYITVERTGGSSGIVSVDYTTVDDTAFAGNHYTSVSGTLTWGDGDSDLKSIPCIIANDSVYNGYLYFSYELSNSTGGAAIGVQNPLIVQISDNDAPPVPAGLNATAGNRKVILKWDAVNSAYYKIYYSTAPGGFSEDKTVNVYDAETYEMTGLSNGTKYYFAVKSGHNIYLSELSDIVSAVPKSPFVSSPKPNPKDEEITEEPVVLPEPAKTQTFDDVSLDSWYYEAVEFIRAKNITQGIGNNKFGPELKLTRAQFVVMLMKAYEIDADKNDYSIENFSDAGNYYYSRYLHAAKASGIIKGIGDNIFAPDKEISRQEMFVMLYSALIKINKIPAADSDKGIKDFKDASLVAAWAEESMAALIEGSIVNGNNSYLYPDEFITRAEAAQVLFNILK